MQVVTYKAMYINSIATDEKEECTMLKCPFVFYNIELTLSSLLSRPQKFKSPIQQSNTYKGVIIHFNT